LIGIFLYKQVCKNGGQAKTIFNTIVVFDRNDIEVLTGSGNTARNPCPNP
jgi:hypothetical protein